MTRFSILLPILLISEPAAGAEGAMAPDGAAEERAPPAEAKSALVSAAPASPRRASENVVTEAEDAFGFSVGRESIGLYSSSNVRGFSPLAAGNVRIEGLYFDPYLTLMSRLRR